MLDRATLIDFSATASRQADGFANVLDSGDGRSAAVKAIVSAIDGLRLAILVTASESQTVEEDDPGQWMRVELFGHQLTYGIVREVTRYGRRWLQVTWPEVATRAPEGADEPPQRTVPEHSKLYHPNAVYGMDEVTEDVGMERVRYQSGIRHPDDDIGF